MKKVIPTLGPILKKDASGDPVLPFILPPHQTIDEVALLKRVEIVSASLIFTGYSNDLTALTSEAKWLIKRISTIGGEVVTEWASADFDQIWDDRVSLFPTITFDNFLSIVFDGIDDFISFGDVTAFSFAETDAFSLSTWAKSTVSGGKFIEKKDGHGYKWEGTGAGDFKLELKDSANDQIKVKATVKPPELEDGDWHYYTVTYDGSNLAAGITMYIDGSSIALTVERDEGLIDMANTGSFNIGADSNGNGNFEGNLDEVSVWDKELSAAEVTEIYNSGDPADLLLHSAETNLVSWWRMGDGDVLFFPAVRDQKNTNDGTMINMNSGDIVEDVP